MTELSLTVVPKDLYYVECALVARQAAEIEKLKRTVSALQEERIRWRADNGKLEAEIEKLRRALEFYADYRRYQGSNNPTIEGDPYQPPDCPYLWDVGRDGGAIAKRAIGPSAMSKGQSEA